MPRISPTDAAAKWVQRTSAAVPDYQAGVMRVTQAPGQAAARQQQAYLNGVQAAAASGKWANNVGAVSLQDWQTAASQKGGQRLAQGVQQAQAKMEGAMARVFPMIDAVQREVSSMDTSTPEGRIAKATAFMTGMYRQGQRAGGRGR